MYAEKYCKKAIGGKKFFDAFPKNLMSNVIYKLDCRSCSASFVLDAVLVIVAKLSAITLDNI